MADQPTSLDCANRLICVCCQEALPSYTPNLTQCCLLPICSDCLSNNQAFTCPICATVVTKSTGMVWQWFRQELQRNQTDQDNFTKLYLTQLQLTAKYRQDNYLNTMVVDQTLAETFNAANLDLATVRAQLTQLSQATNKALDLAQGQYSVVLQRLYGLQQLSDYLSSLKLNQLTLDHLENVLLIRQRLTTLPSPTVQSYHKIVSLSHRYGVSVYRDDFKAKLARFQATESPLRIIPWPDAETWTTLIGSESANYFGQFEFRVAPLEWPQANHFGYLLRHDNGKAFMAVTLTPLSQVESFRYPDTPAHCRVISSSPFWLVWLASSDSGSHQILYHQGLTGRPGDRGDITELTKPAKIIDLEACQDYATISQANCLVDGDYLYLNTDQGLYRKYLLDDQPPQWFSSVTKVMYFCHGWYLRQDNVNTLMGRLNRNGQILSQQVVDKVDTVRIFSSNTVAVRYRDSRQITFHNAEDSFIWPGILEHLSGFKISSQGDLFDLDEATNIVFY